MPNLLMNGYLRIVDVPGLGAGMRLHEEITLEEMKREDAMIVLVTDAGRQRVDEMKSLSAVNWIKENRLFGLSGGDLDEAAVLIEELPFPSAIVFTGNEHLIGSPWIPVLGVQR